MLPIILSGVDEDDDELLIQANNNQRDRDFIRNETSPLFQDNLRCTVGRRIVRRISTDQSDRTRSTNQSNLPGERIIEIKSDSEDESDHNVPTSSTTLLNEKTNLINDYRFQRFRPIRIQEHDLTSSDHHSQARMRRNYQILKSKKRFTFPIFFFVGLYISFLFLASFVFTLFEQKATETDQFYEINRELVTSLTSEQYELVMDLIEKSVQMHKNGIDVIGILNENRMMVNERDIETYKSTTNQQIKQSNDNLSTETPITRSTNEQFVKSIDNSNDESVNLIDVKPATNRTIKKRLRRSIETDERSIITNQSMNRRKHNWEFQQALFYVVSIATTIGYGNLTPESANGKIFTIFFGMLAIPYTTILFSIVVSKFSNGPLRRFKLRLLTKHFEEKSHETLRIIRFICLILATIFILTFILGLPAILFVKMEDNWHYLDSFYFIFISITTTGLGDFVPEFHRNWRHWIYEVGVIIFLYFGIIMIMLWLTLIKSVFRRSTSIKLDEYDRDEEDAAETVLEEHIRINYHYHQKNYVNYGSCYGYDEVSVRVPK